MAKESGPPSEIRGMLDAVGAAINSIKLNGVSSGRRRGRWLRVKRRHMGSEGIATLANLFFPMADAPLTVLGDLKQWQRWEIDCFKLLNGDEFCAFATGPRTVCAEKLPGRSLRKLAAIGKLNHQALQAAAREIRRAHQLHFDGLDGPWSHGDLHMGNVIYDERTDRARLIDFEIMHDKSLPAVRRHADDVLGFLQDMVGTVSGRQWLSFALCFHDTYGRRPVIARVRKLLVVPNGIPGFWWKIRTNYVDRGKLLYRIDALCRALDARTKGKARRSRPRKTAHRRAPARVGRGG